MKVMRYQILVTLALITPLARGEHFTCVSFDYPPLIRANAGDAPKGAAVNIVRSVFKRMGHELTIEVYPWSRSLSLASKGERDCIFTIVRSPEREKLFDFSNVVLAFQPIYFYARKDSNASFHGDLSELKQYRIGTAFMLNYGRQFEKMRDSLTIDEAPSIKLNFLKLLAGRVDLVPSYDSTASEVMNDIDFPATKVEVVRLPTALETVPSYIAFSKSKNLTALRDRFDIELRKLIAPGDGERVSDKFSAAAPR